MFRGAASARDMFKAFLRAELDSPTEARRLHTTLDKLGLDETFILGDAADSYQLQDLFQHYRGGERVFDGLELGQLDWQWFDLSLADLESKTFTCRNNFEDRYGTRSVAAVAEIWGRASKPNGIQLRVSRGDQLQPPILVGDAGLSRLVIVEGHNRLISYLRCRAIVRFPVLTLVGTGESVHNWCQW